jgi:hypothetical protein
MSPVLAGESFSGMTAASLLMARSLSASAAAEAKNGIPYRPLGRTGEKVSLVGLGGYHLARQSAPAEIELSEPDSMKESISSIRERNSDGQSSA